MSEGQRRAVEPADGKLGVLLVGLGAVATTYVAGVENMRQGRAKPVGSLAEAGTIRPGETHRLEESPHPGLRATSGGGRPGVWRLGSDS